MMETTWKKKVKRSTNEKPITDPALRQALERCGTTFDEEGRATNLEDAFEVLDEFDMKLIELYGEAFHIYVNEQRRKYDLKPL
ncbi:MAG: hypothetical protein LBL81_02685 [Tannerella sp.]|nr:hypothetical protein [Tannerella sp.]